MEDKKRNILDHTTLVPLGVLGLLVGAAISWGVMYNRVVELEKKVDVLQDYSDRITTLEVQNKQILSTLSEIKVDIKALNLNSYATK